MGMIGIPYAKYAIGIFVGIAAIFIFTHYKGLTNTIESLQADIVARDNFISKQQDTINLERSHNALLTTQKDSLLNSIEVSNKALDDIKVKNDINAKELEEWKKKVAKDGYEYRKEIERLHGTIDNEKLKLGDCEEGLKLNKSISELDYDKI